MSNLPGNPDYENAKLSLAGTVLSADDQASTLESILIDHAHATLALAYEQRTANLIALAQLHVTAEGSSVDLGDDVEEIAERLGMRAEK